MSDRSGTSSRRRPTRVSSRRTPSAGPRRRARLPELSRVVLTRDLPDHGLAAGDVGTVVDVYADGAGYEVEFTSLRGETIAVVTLTGAQVRLAAGGEIAHARKRAS